MIQVVHSFNALRIERPKFIANMSYDVGFLFLEHVQMID